MLRIFAVGTLGAYWIAIFVGTHVPLGVQGLERVHDKLLHFGAYAGLAFLLAATLTTLGLRRSAILLPLAVAAIYGCLDELSQIAVPGRRAELTDWVADVLGACIGVLAFRLLSLAVAKFFAGSPAVPTEAARKSAA